MNDCLETGILQAYIDRELGETDRRRTASHLAICRSCALELEARRLLTVRVDGLLGALSAAPQTNPSRNQGRRPWFTWTAAAAMVVAASFAGSLIRHRATTPRQEQRPNVAKAMTAAPPAPSPAEATAPPAIRRSAPRSEDFIRLDDSLEPIQTARVNLPASMFDPSEPVDSLRMVPAEVILNVDGEPKAIRFLQ